MDISALLKDPFEVWVPFLDGKVFVRYVSREELHRLDREATEFSWERGSPIRKERDPAKADILLGRAAVRGWQGFTLEGIAFPYTVENCDFLMARWVEFAKFVNEACVDLQVLADAEKEESEKNS